MLVAYLDPQFNFVRVNRAYAKADGREPSFFPGKNHFELYPSDAKEIFDKVVKNKKMHTVAARPFVFPDKPEWGTTYWDWTLLPILDNKGEVDKLLFTLKDVTKQKISDDKLFKSYDELRKKEKDLLTSQKLALVSTRKHAGRRNICAEMSLNFFPR